ncbi:MAG: efflux RND transporter periplasmic adaptor subunit [Planctomycetaceae bacterium]
MPNETTHPQPAVPAVAHGGHPQPAGDRLRRGLTGGAILAAGGLAWWWFATHPLPGGPDHVGAGPAGAASEAARDVVTLPAASAGDIVLVKAELRPVRESLTVPGRLDYDARLRLSYESPVDGIVSRVLVQVRQKVAKGDPLAEVSSPDVGIARDDVRKREADREIERKAADWAATIAANVDELLDLLAAHPPLDEVEGRFRDRVLGAYREKILAPYSRLLFVEKVSASTRQLGEGGVLSGRIVEERTSNLEVARASFAAACEAARFDTRQERDRARAALEQADRLVQVARENLRTLVGSRLDAGGSGVVAEDGEQSPGEAAGLSTLVLRTPFDGVVEEIFMSRGERVKAGDRLFVVADTSTLWVRAQINERQWTQVELAEGQEVHVHMPGAVEHEATARINHVAATVEEATRSVPLVAEIENDDAHFKPGMFVWVDLPEGGAREAVTVPAEAVMRHKGKAFVFVPEGTDRFRRVDVETGAESDGFVEVTGGLDAGREVVARGAFLLKSALLLEDEA